MYSTWQQSCHSLPKAFNSNIKVVFKPSTYLLTECVYFWLTAFLALEAEQWLCHVTFSCLDGKRFSRYCPIVFTMNQNDLYLSFSKALSEREWEGVVMYCHSDSWDKVIFNDEIFHKEHPRKDKFPASSGLMQQNYCNDAWQVCLRFYTCFA